MLARPIAALLLPILLAGPASGATTTPIVAIEAAGTSFKLTLSDGTVRHSPDLVGAVLVVELAGETAWLRIDAVERDPLDKRQDAGPEDAVWLHSFSVAAEDGSWRNLCQPGPDGRTQGFPLAGRARPDGTLEAAEPGTFDLVCSAGARAKCVRFGYLPWMTMPAVAAISPTYNACVHMVRADYAGDDQPKTKNGMIIDIYDDGRIQTPDMNPEHEFEAGWMPEGAVCVRHPRVKENVTLAELEKRVPRLAGRTGAICTEGFARAHGALVFNRSRP